jgi:hypothetical protein
MISCRALLQQSAPKVVALLLVLHWTAPNLRPFQPVPEPPNSTPIYATAELGVHSGTLPRALARMQTLDAGVPKTQRSPWLSAGKLATLASAGRADALPSFAVELIIRPAPRVAILAHAFEARGPPIL